MTSSRRFLALALCLLFATGFLAPVAAAAANRCAGGGGSRPDEGGIGGTGLQPDGAGGDADGIGGTGLQPGGDEDDSGVGGTGISTRGDTGVIGTITGFASICVGGVEIHYGADSRVRIDGRSASLADLAVGQVVEVVAGGSGDELSARQINVRHLVAGPVTRVDAEHNELEVIGQTIRLSDVTRGGAADDSLAVAGDFAPGTAVRVSGMRQADGVIAASRVDAGTADHAWLSGPVGQPGVDEVSVAGTPIRVADGSPFTVGEEVRVSGRWDGSRLVAGAVDRIPQLPFDGRVGRLEIEGFASTTAAGQLRVGSYVFDLSPATRAGALPFATAHERVRIEAVVDGRRAVIERVGAPPAPPPRPERPGDAAGARPPHQPPAGDRPLDDVRSLDAARPAAAARPNRPDRPDRPLAPGIPDRPSLLERPPIPDRATIPQRPPRIERPPRMERPFRPDRPGG